MTCNVHTSQEAGPHNCCACTIQKYVHTKSKITATPPRTDSETVGDGVHDSEDVVDIVTLPVGEGDEESDTLGVFEGLFVLDGVIDIVFVLLAEAAAVFEMVGVFVMLPGLRDTLPDLLGVAETLTLGEGEGEGVHELESLKDGVGDAEGVTVVEMEGVTVCDSLGVTD